MTTAQNSNALVSAGFLLKLENNIVQSASLVYECLTDTFFRAKTTENFLIGKKLFDNCTLQSAYKNLANEISPISNELNTSPEFRRQLAVSLFYKVNFFLIKTKQIQTLISNSVVYSTY